MTTTNDTGSSSLQERLWREHSTELVRYGTLLVGPHDAADIVSAAFIRASRYLAEERVENQRAYLFRAVTNAAHDHRRRTTSRRARDLLAVVAAAPPTPDSQIDVRRAVAGLSVRQRSIVYLAYWEDMSERSIAEFLDLSLGSVRRHMSRAQTHLRKALR